MRYELFGRLSLAAVAFSLAASAGLAGSSEYDGVCEVSAAAKLDDSHFIVASDETQTLTVYKRYEATPLASFGVGDVTDIEAAARVGNTIFWLTSHSLNKEGEDKKKRKLLLATSYDPQTQRLALIGEYRQLRAQIASALAMQEDALKGELNIEGLAATPEGDLLVGLRSPLPAGKTATVVKLKNPLDPGNHTEAAAAVPRQDTAELPLGERGIRSLEKIATGDHAYLIVAGSVEDKGQSPLLFWWDGISKEVNPGPEVDLAGMTPEAVIAWNEHEFEIFGDNGDTCSDESDNRRWFPSLNVKW
ncbi:DUF3616 domain-containing protein [Sinorhizobium meliloti]|uniref:DUF3616 domain-containing protein n=1 Tax=Rhizobium meliloti TaxID=382 RepID=UPI000EFCD459|nr:DUF3616 domain-containing protein [Sinorhizobium meliloti]RMC64893.1 DUF3616 domain-containing protein [Sinorhizobium meliloti]